MAIAVKRVYEKPARADGTRVLVDRLWPRGLTKEKAAIDEWLRDLAPSDELRRWFIRRGRSAFFIWKWSEAKISSRQDASG